MRTLSVFALLVVSAVSFASDKKAWVFTDPKPEVKPVVVPVVTNPAPFVFSPREDTTPVTTVRVVEQPNTLYTASGQGMVLMPINAPIALPYGVTSYGCVNGNCSAPPRWRR